MSTTVPPNFPPKIEISQQTFQNWDGQIVVPNLWTCAPKSSEDVAVICNWAVQAGYKVRARGIMHTWSPLTVAEPGSSDAKILLVDTTKYLTAIDPVSRTATGVAQVKVQVGATMQQLLFFLEQQPGGQGAAPGYSFPHVPAPGNLTVGGALAIDAHGTAVPSDGDSFKASYGSLSNQILAFTAVVTDPASPNPSQYALKTFQRTDADAAALLAHVGRGFLVDVTLQLIDNYNLRCRSYTNIPNETLFQKPSGGPLVDHTVGGYLKESGRVEVIWYPFTTTSWLKVWTNKPKKPTPSQPVNAPYNYPFSDNLPDWITSLIKQITTDDPSATKMLGPAMITLTDWGLKAYSAVDIWGPSKNTLLYVKDTTLRVTANGYAIHMKSESVQQAVYEFTTKFSEMLTGYAANNQYPVNAPLEIRITSLDEITNVAASPAQPPVISALSPSSVDAQNGWDVAVWFDVLTLPETPYSNDFYAELETWIYQNFSGTYGCAYPEWSKGWAYTSENGPWTNTQYMEKMRQLFIAGRTSANNWNYQVATFAKYDKSDLFTNPLLSDLFVST